MNGLRTAFLAALLFLTTARACPAGPLDRVRQAFVDVSVMSYAPDGEATERFVRYSDYGRANDVLLLQLYTSVHLPDGEVRRLMSDSSFFGWFFRHSKLDFVFFREGFDPVKGE